MFIKSKNSGSQTDLGRMMASLNNDETASTTTNSTTSGRNNNNNNHNNSQRDKKNNNNNSNSNNNNNNNNNSSNHNNSTQSNNNTNISNHNNSTLHLNNNNNNNDNTSQSDATDAKGRRESLEQRKHDLENLLREKCWFLQQLQHKETKILNGDYEFISLNEIFAGLAHQYRQEMNGQGGAAAPASAPGGSDSPSPSILRRKSLSVSGCKDSKLNNNIPIIINRSSEYDNYPGEPAPGLEHDSAADIDSKKNSLNHRSAVPLQYYVQQQQQQHSMHIQIEQQQKMVVVQQTPPAAPPPLQQKQLNLLQQQQQQMLQKHQMLSMQQLQKQQQQQLQRDELNEMKYMADPANYHHHPAPDAITLISVNSVNSGGSQSMRHPGGSSSNKATGGAQPQTMIIQCDKYYLSPTHQSYNEGGFIKCSQNIKKYESPTSAASGRHYPPPHTSSKYEMHQGGKSSKKMYPLQPLDLISLDPSYTSSTDSTADGHQATHNYRWRSQTSIPHSVSSAPAHHHAQPQLGHPHQHPHAAQPQTQPHSKSNSSDMLSYRAGSPASANVYLSAASSTTHIQQKSPYDDAISITSLHNDLKKSSKSKQWTESSLDGPVMRMGQPPGHSQVVVTNENVARGHQPPASVSLVRGVMAQKPPVMRDRNKLSSQSMCSARYYAKTMTTTNALKDCLPGSLQYLHSDDEAGRYAKLSQSTSFLNASAAAAAAAEASHYPAAHPSSVSNASEPNVLLLRNQRNHMPAGGGYAPVKGPNETPPSQSPRPPSIVPPPSASAMDKQLNISVQNPSGGVSTASLSPDIHIESPKNMTVVQQATFQPYKEVTKPFEMSDFYKYSTKFRQKE